MQLLGVINTGGGYEVRYLERTDKEGVVERATTFAELENYEELLHEVRGHLTAVREVEQLDLQPELGVLD